MIKQHAIDVYAEPPKCCKTCVYLMVEGSDWDYEHSTEEDWQQCELGLFLPVVKQTCKKHKPIRIKDGSDA